MTKVIKSKIIISEQIRAQQLKVQEPILKTLRILVMFHNDFRKYGKKSL